MKVRLKGKFKIDDHTSTNPIAVGDIVEVGSVEDEESIVITDIHSRRNYINRVSPHNKNQHHIVASNLDQSLLFATLKDPKTSSGFIDRFLVTSEAYHVPSLLVFNKADLYGKKEMENFAQLKGIYEQIGYQVFLISLYKNDDLEELKDSLKDKTTLLTGHSGVGKSTFINYLFPELNITTKEVSGWSGKGMHTTTFAEMYDLDFGGRVIDTPGIREMGLVDVGKTELSHYFPEMLAVLNNCKYNDCIHIDESECAVKAGLLTGTISESRFISYLKILDSLNSKY